MWRQAGVAACHLGTDGIEIDEPGLEQRPRHRLQRLIYPPVQLDLVVQGAQDVRDNALLFYGWQYNRNAFDDLLI